VASIEIQGVCKKFGDIPVLKDVNVDIANGEFVVLVGPSGCGKSTLLRMIAGLEPITDGNILINGTVVNTLMPKDRDIAMVFQNYALYPTMNVFENMAFNLRLRRLAKDEISDRVGRAAETLNLTEFLGRMPSQLSGGQRQRVAMGRAIVRNPQAFLFDEPLSNLDAKLRVQMRTEIRELHQQIRTTAVYVTHDQTEAMTMADRIIVMNAGHIEQIGTPDEVFDHPANVFVAEFIGSPSMNLIRGRVRRANAGTIVSSDGVNWPVPNEISVADGEEVLYGVRPEHLQLVDGEEGLPGRVRLIESLGSETLVFCDIQGREICMKVFDRLRFGPQETIRLAPKPQSVHLFNVMSGARLAA